MTKLFKSHNPSSKPSVFLIVSRVFCLLMLCLLLGSCASRIAPATKDANSQMQQEKVTKPKSGDIVPTSNEVLKDFHIRVPDSIAIGEAFEIRLTTIGSLGSKPFFVDDESLQLNLTSSIGKIEPASSEMQGGIAEIQALLTEVAASNKTVELEVSLRDINQNLITRAIALNIK